LALISLKTAVSFLFRHREFFMPRHPELTILSRNVGEVAFPTLPATDEIILTVSGEVQNPLCLSLGNVFDMPTANLSVDSMVCSRHRKRVQEPTTYKGVLLKTLLMQAVIKADKPIYQIPFYVLATNSQGDACLFSWHELFNTPVGEQVILAYSKNNQHLCSESGYMCLFATSDTYLLPRHLKGVNRIEVQRVTPCKL
jgi:DMSO/TMAO reductase YedYZ molybdopterin-dependent catalytic subunit